MASLVLCSLSAVHAQTSAPPAASPNSPPSKIAPGPTGIPANKTTEPDLDQAFKQMDANHDGKLGRDEVALTQSLAQRFARMDSNGDGFVSRDEFDKAAKL
ncbi:MAG: EF-hand domain-containing protein [Pseudomonadota bacterium]